jgi:hypothetical protein
VQGGLREGRKFSRELRDELIDAVTLVAEWDTVYRNNETKRDRAERVNRPTPDLELSDAGLDYFNMFFKLCAFRTQGMSSPDPIQPGTMRDWSLLSRNDLEPWEMELLMEMDTHYLRKIREMSELHREADKARDKGYQTNGHRDDRI